MVKFEEDKSTKGIEQIWVVPYGNLMTFMMIFFFLLYAFTFQKQNVNYERVVTQVRKQLGEKDEKLRKEITQQEKETDLASKVDSYVADSNLRQYARVDINAKQIRIVLATPVLFESGKDVLSDSTKVILREVANMLKTIDNPVIIEGHTDNVPILGGKFHSNWELSLARAISVIKFFQDECGLDPKRFAAAGYGEFRPVASNDTEAGRAQNRRIEIIIIRSS